MVKYISSMRVTLSDFVERATPPTDKSQFETNAQAKLSVYFKVCVSHLFNVLTYRLTTFKHFIVTG